MNENNIAKQTPDCKERWSELTKAYSKVLFPLINREGYGCKYLDGRVWKNVHCNTKEELYLFHSDRRRYFRKYGIAYLHEFKKDFLELVTNGTSPYYFTGGLRKLALVMIDFDAHNGEPDLADLVRHVSSFLPSHYSEPSDRGHHLYLVIDKQGLSPEVMNEFYAYLGKVLRRERVRFGFAADVEVKGTIQHPLPGSYYCGVLARIPQITTPEQLQRFKAVQPVRTSKFLALLKERDRRKEELKEQENKQIILTSKKVEKSCDKPNECSELQPGKVLAKAGSSATARRMTGFWEFTRKEGRVPEVTELLEFIRSRGLFSAPWTYHEKERETDCRRIIENNKHKYKPERAVTNYNGLAKELATTAPAGINWEDISIYLSVVETAVVKNPNSDGSVPYRRVEELWPNVARHKGLKRKWQAKRSAAVRRFLESREVLTMTDDSYGHGRAMKFTIGPRHPQFGTVGRIIPPARFADGGIDPGFDPSRYLPRAV